MPSVIQSFEDNEYLEWLDSMLENSIFTNFPNLTTITNN
jgi:hypothetical protein